MTLVHLHRAFAGIDGSPGIVDMTPDEAARYVGTDLASYVDDDPQPELAVDGVTPVPGDAATIAELQAYLNVEGLTYDPSARKAELQQAVRDHLTAAV